jgi:hypothetical protein
MGQVLERVGVLYPTLDAADQVLDQRIRYCNFLVDETTFVSEQFDNLLQMAIINHQNPDWTFFQSAEEQKNITLRPGDQQFDVNGQPLAYAQLNLRANPNAKIDHWYGSSKFGIYGVAFFGTSLGPSTPAIFLNTPTIMIDAPTPDYPWLFVTLKPGVFGDGYIQPIAPYPYMQIATYPSGEDPIWLEYGYPVSLGIQSGKGYPTTVPVPPAG